MRRLLTLCMYAAICGSAVAQESPRLVVGITIDQLRTDFLESFSALYGENGFKRLFRNGQVYKNVKYPFKHISKASAAATIVSGTSPYTHGIVADGWINRKNLQFENCVEDRAVAGYNTQVGSSPNKLLVSTIGDEIKLATEGKGLVYSIATDRLISVLSAGHAADWALWIDEKTGNWAGSKYYGERPPYWVSPLEFEERTLIEKGSNNARVTRAANYCITSGTCGADHITDFLSLSYDAGGTVNANIDNIRQTYIELDMEIANLLQTIERSVGIDKTLIYLTSTGYNESPTLLQTINHRIPTQEFSMSRCMALLNMYLVALHGKGNYVEAYFDNHIYIDNKLLEEKKLKVQDVLQECENFLYQFDGIQEVYTSTRLLQGAWSPQQNYIRNGYNRKHSGDIIIEIAPGCTVEDSGNGKIKVWRTSWVDFPLFFFGYKLEAKQETTPKSIEYIAPTVARYARIRAPNGCEER